MKRKILIILLVILGIVNLYPCLMQIGIVMTSDYMIMCTEEDKEYISKYWKGREDYTFAILDIEGFLHPSSKAKIIINSFPYPNVFRKGNNNRKK